MQQKSHEILSAKCSSPGSEGSPEGSGDERQARRLLAAAEEALAADWPHDHHRDLSVSISSHLDVHSSLPTKARST